MSSREAVRKALRIKIEPVEINGEKFHVRSLSGERRHVYTQLHAEAKAVDKIVPAHITAALGICDEQGTLLYDYEKPDDLAEILEFDAAEVDGIAIKIFRLSGLTKEALDEAEKKSTATPSS